MAYEEFSKEISEIIEQEADIEVAMHRIRELYESLEEDNDY